MCPGGLALSSLRWPPTTCHVRGPAATCHLEVAQEAGALRLQAHRFHGRSGRVMGGRPSTLCQCPDRGPRGHWWGLVFFSPSETSR